jgi:hypothetical protein
VGPDPGLAGLPHHPLRPWPPADGGRLSARPRHRSRRPAGPHPRPGVAGSGRAPAGAAPTPAPGARADPLRRAPALPSPRRRVHPALPPAPPPPRLHPGRRLRAGQPARPGRSRACAHPGAAGARGRRLVGRAPPRPRRPRGPDLSRWPSRPAADRPRAPGAAGARPRSPVTNRPLSDSPAPPPALAAIQLRRRLHLPLRAVRHVAPPPPLPGPRCPGPEPAPSGPSRSRSLPTPPRRRGQPSAARSPLIAIPKPPTGCSD